MYSPRTDTPSPTVRLHERTRPTEHSKSQPAPLRALSRPSLKLLDQDGRRREYSAALRNVLRLAAASPGTLHERRRPRPWPPRNRAGAVVLVPQNRRGHTVDYATRDQIPGVLSFAHNERLHGRPRQADLRVPEPQFPSKPARSSPVTLPVPPPDCPQPRRPSERSTVEQLRWARCSDEGRLHLLQPADVAVATTRGHTQAVCGRRISDEGLTITNGASGALCMACVVGATFQEGSPGPFPVS
jgi:hypothetical protein